MEVKSLKGKSLFATFKMRINQDMEWHNLKYSFMNNHIGMVFNTDKGELIIPYQMYNDLCEKGYHSNDEMVVIVIKK